MNDREILQLFFERSVAMQQSPSAASVVAVHVLSDVLTIVAMWYLALRAHQVERRSLDAIVSKDPPLGSVSQI